MSTDRHGWKVGDDTLRTWINALLAEGRAVVAPTEEEGLRSFRSIDTASQACLDTGHTAWSPKEVVLPRTETLYHFRYAHGQPQVRDPVPEEPQSVVLLGVRCCDAAGIERLDSVFLGDPPDPFYARRREALTVVTLACFEAQPECFCTSVGGSPVVADSSDIRLLPVDGGFIVEATSERGEALLAPVIETWTQATEEDWTRVAELSRTIEDELGTMAAETDWPALLERSFDHPVWDRLAETCVGCSVCASICPSCSCFDMHDEGSAWAGDKIRVWDGCTFPLFTLHASGHNPRSSQAQRYRQRVMHKFSYYPLEHAGEFGCVGCGRCIASCPAGLDIHKAVQRVVEAVGSEDSPPPGG